MKDEYKTIGIASALITLNIFLMAGIRFTPLAGLMDYVFTYLILGVLFFGALLTGGVYIAKKGIRNNNKTLAVAGTAILQGSYGLFGGGVLSWVPPESITLALGITFVISLLIALLSAGLVYLTNKDFSNWGTYSTYLFLGVIGLSLFGTFLPFFEIIAFFMALVGFITYLIHEIYILRKQQTTSLMNALGIYVAFMGVFVQILQMVIRYYIEE